MSEFIELLPLQSKNDFAHSYRLICDYHKDNFEKKFGSAGKNLSFDVYFSNQNICLYLPKNNKLQIQIDENILSDDMDLDISSRLYQEYSALYSLSHAVIFNYNKQVESLADHPSTFGNDLRKFVSDISKNMSLFYLREVYEKKINSKHNLDLDGAPEVFISSVSRQIIKEDFTSGMDKIIFQELSRCEKKDINKHSFKELFLSSLKKSSDILDFLVYSEN